MGLALAAQAADPSACVLVASPLGRTLQTARIVARSLGIAEPSIELDDRLKELSWGDWDGMTRPEIEARWPGALAARYADPLAHWNHRPSNGESFAAAVGRAADWLHAARKRDAMVIAVAHGGIGRVLRGVHTGLGPAETLRQDEPQDAFFHLHRHGIDRIAAGPVS
jgi:broad specificity phosphatase PhoE